MVQLEKRRISTFEALFFFRRFSSRLVAFCLLLFSSSTEALKFFFFLSLFPSAFHIQNK